MKPFNVEEWKAGRKAVMSDGREVRVLCTDRKGLSPVVCLCVTKKGEERIVSFGKDGKAKNTTYGRLMLESEKVRKFVNVYPNKEMAGSKLYDTAEEAAADADFTFPDDGVVLQVSVEYEL